MVASHDPTLNPDITRTLDGKWLRSAGPRISALPASALANYDVGRIRPRTRYAALYRGQTPADGARIPTLESVLLLDDQIRFNIELKTFPSHPELGIEAPAMADCVVEVGTRTNTLDRIIIQSFDWRGPRQVRRNWPDVTVAWLTSPRTLGAAEIWWDGRHPDDFGGSVPRAVAAEGGPIWSPEHRALTEDVVAEAHALGLKVIPWTVNQPREMARLIRIGVDGLITDRPDRARRIFAEHGIPLPPARQATIPVPAPVPGPALPGPVPPGSWQAEEVGRGAGAGHKGLKLRVLLAILGGQRVHGDEILVRVRDLAPGEALIMPRLQSIHDADIARTGRTKSIVGACRSTPVACQRGVGSSWATRASSQGTGQTARSDWVLGAKRERLSSKFCNEPHASIAKISTNGSIGDPAKLSQSPSGKVRSRALPGKLRIGLVVVLCCSAGRPREPGVVAAAAGAQSRRPLRPLPEACPNHRVQRHILLHCFSSRFGWAIPVDATCGCMDNVFVSFRERGFAGAVREIHEQSAWNRSLRAGSHPVPAQACLRFHPLRSMTFDKKTSLLKSFACRS